MCKYTRSLSFLTLSLIVLTIASCKKQQKSTPVCQIISPLNYAQVLREDTAVVMVSASSADANIVKVKFFLDKKLVFTDESTPSEFPMTDLKFKRYALDVIAFDDHNAESNTARVDLSVIGNKKVSVNLQFAPTQYPLAGDTLTFTATPQFGYGQIKSAEFWRNDTLIGTDSAPPFQCIYKGLPKGDQYFYASATDEAGHQGVSEGRFFSVQQNTPPSINIVCPSTSDSVFYPGTTAVICMQTDDHDSQLSRIDVYANDQVIKTFISPSDYETVSWETGTGGTYVIKAKATDNRCGVGYSQEIHIRVLPGVILQGMVTNLTYSEDEHLVFALNTGSQELELLDPVTKQLVKSIPLNYENPVRMRYSIPDRKLYIIYGNSGVLSVYNKTTEQFTDILYSTYTHGQDLAIDPVNRRIYIATTYDGLYILNLDNGNVINKGLTFYTQSIDFDPTHRWLFSEYWPTPCMLRKYNVTGDTLSLIQEKEVGNYPGKLALNTAGTMAIVPCREGNEGAQNYHLYGYNTPDLSTTSGEFDFGKYIIAFAYSCMHDDRYVIYFFDM
jgi:hypothetical protein